MTVIRKSKYKWTKIKNKKIIIKSLMKPQGKRDQLDFPNPESDEPPIMVYSEGYIMRGYI
jgi:hypothetical protein